MAAEGKKINGRILAILVAAPIFISLVLGLIGALAEGFSYEWYMIFAGAALGSGLVLVVCAIIAKNRPMNLVGAFLFAIGFPAVLARYAGISAWAAIIIGLIILIFCIILSFLVGMRVAPPADNEKPEYKNYLERRAEQKAKEEEEAKPQEEIVFKRYDDDNK